MALELSIEVEHPRCVYCRDSVKPGARKTACDDCMAWHHLECWDEYGRCAACGCRFDVTQSRARLRPTPRPAYLDGRTPPPDYARPR